MSNLRSIDEKFCLKWNDFERNISSSFQDIKNDEDFLDVTIACDDNQIRAHKLVLSACSPFFRSFLKKNPHQHPLLYLKGVKHEHLLLVLNFMYHGEVNVAQEELNSFLAVSEDLQVKGLTQSETRQDRRSNIKEYRRREDRNQNQAFPENRSPATTHFESPSKIRKQGFSTIPSNNATEKVTDRKDEHNTTQQMKTENPSELECFETEVPDHQVVEAFDHQEENYHYDQTYHEEDVNYMMQEPGKVMPVFFINSILKKYFEEES